MTKAVVLKSFPYSVDGMRARKLAVDEEIDLTERQYTSLLGAGLVGAVGGSKRAVTPVADTSPPVGEADDSKPAKRGRPKKTDSKFRDS